MESSDLIEKNTCMQDELRIKKLFQACDTNRDGYIDSHDLLAICRELNLEHSLDELMRQLGADSNGRISYEQFLKRRLDLRPEIDALKCSDAATTDVDEGRLDSWEWDSGARDLSPVPNQAAILKNREEMHESDAESSIDRCAVQKLLDDQAQRYDEQITELHSVIAELTRKLQQQRTLAIAEEDENSEVAESVSLAEDSNDPNCDISNQSETSQSNKGQSVDEENAMQILPEIILKSTAEANIVEVNDKVVSQQKTWPHHQSQSTMDQYRTVRSSDAAINNAPSQPIVTKMAERVRLRRAVEQQTNEHCPTIECENGSLDVEVARLNAQLDHARAQNALLALTLDDAKEQSNRLSLLCGKYESNAIALSVALRLTDSAIEAYDVLLALLETELSLDESRPASVENRAHVEMAAFHLLARLDQSVSSGTVLPTVKGKWSGRHEARLREHVSRLKQERVNVRNTCVQFESVHLDGASTCTCRLNGDKQNAGQNSQHEMRKMDLETAVLLQEMMLLREQKAELVSRLLKCEGERDSAMNRLQQISDKMASDKR